MTDGSTSSGAVDSSGNSSSGMTTFEHSSSSIGTTTTSSGKDDNEEEENSVDDRSTCADSPATDTSHRHCHSRTDPKSSCAFTFPTFRRRCPSRPMGESKAARHRHHLPAACALWPTNSTPAWEASAIGGRIDLSSSGEGRGTMQRTTTCKAIPIYLQCVSLHVHQARCSPCKHCCLPPL